MHKPIAKVMIVLAFAAVNAFGADNSLGTWKLNLEKSKYTPAPFPVKSQTAVREAAEGGVKLTVTGERVDGSPINYTYTAKYDGTSSTVTGTGMTYDTISVKQVSANTLTDERKKAGSSYHTTGRTVISNAGKTLTLTLRGTTADGKPTTGSFVFEKQ